MNPTDQEDTKGQVTTGCNAAKRSLAEAYHQPGGTLTLWLLRCHLIKKVRPPLHHLPAFR